jgi:hypothetical protein
MQGVWALWVIFMVMFVVVVAFAMTWLMSHHD